MYFGQTADFLLMGSLRYEGDSRFGANHKWGVFPAVSGGWRISQEGFLRGATFINDLKLRAGYGVTGIAPRDPYQSLTSYAYGARFPYEGSWVQGLSPSRNPNPDLKWERKDEDHDRTPHARDIGRPPVVHEEPIDSTPRPA